MDQRSIEPAQEFPLGHRAYYMRLAAHGQVVVASNEGEISILSEALQRTGHFALGHKVGSVGLSPDTSRIAITCDRGIRILDAVTGNEIALVPGAFHDAWFDDDDARLWAIRNVSSEQVVAEVRSTHDFAVVHEAEIADPHFSSSWTFYAHPAAGLVTVWAAAGQDGQTSFWLQCTAAGIEVREYLPTDTTPPSFSEDGSEFLVGDDTELRRFGFPDCNLLGQYNVPEEQPALGYEFFYLSAKTALIIVGEGLLAFLDINEMRIDSAVTIRGHEPRPTYEFYPSLANDTELIGDLSGIYRQDAEYFVTSHLALPGEGSGQKHVLVRWRNPLHV